MDGKSFPTAKLSSRVRREARAKGKEGDFPARLHRLHGRESLARRKNYKSPIRVFRGTREKSFSRNKKMNKKIQSRKRQEKQEENKTKTRKNKTNKIKKVKNRRARTENLVSSRNLFSVPFCFFFAFRFFLPSHSRWFFVFGVYCFFFAFASLRSVSPSHLLRSRVLCSIYLS